MKRLGIAAAAVALSGVILFLGSISVVVACVAGGIGFIGLIAWLAMM